MYNSYETLFKYHAGFSKKSGFTRRFRLKCTYMYLMVAIAAIAFITVGSGCTGTGHLQEGEKLYTGAKVKISKPEKGWDTKILKTDLKKSVILPRSNKKLLWMRPKLSIYNSFHNRRSKSVGNFIANRFGEAPILFESKIINRHQELLTERAANDGFFKVSIDTKQKVKKHTVKLKHEVFVKTPREVLDKVEYVNDSTLLTNTIIIEKPESLVRSGQPYYLEDMIAERQRLSDTLRNRGWYFFSPDNLVFEADTLHPAGDVNLRLLVKKEVGERERSRYRIGSITVYPDYNLAQQTDSIKVKRDTLNYNGIRYNFHHLSIKPEILNQQIFLKNGTFYSNNDYQTTIYRLLNLNVYKFINIRFEVSEQADSLLDVKVFLTPNRPERIDASLSAVFSPSFYYGLRAGLGYNHRNIFHGAEALQLSFNGAYLRTDKSNFDFQDFLVSDASARITIPRFLFLPEKQSLAFSTTQFNIRHQSNWFKYDLPEVGKFRLSYQRIQGEAGYVWKKNRRGSVVQEANPINLGLQFSTIDNKAIRQQLISDIPNDTTGASTSLLTFIEFKPNYSFTLDQRLEPSRRLSKYFRQRFAFQASGYTGSKYLPSDYKLASPRNIFIESDYRQYQKTNARNVLAMRLAVGAGIPVRPNGTISILDRYIVGGANSVRAFPPRTIGPGSQERDLLNNGLTVNNYTGNLLIESSIEYRMPIGKYPELAVFMDAGNIWLTSGTDATDASNFKLNRFYRELGVGTGMGLRVNLGFFVLRLDLAFALAKPYLPVGERWVADDLHFGSRSWRQKNLNWNFAFGYPF